MILVKLTCKKEKDTPEETVRIIRDAYKFDKNTVVYIQSKDDYEFLVKRCEEHKISMNRNVILKISERSYLQSRGY